MSNLLEEYTKKHQFPDERSALIHAVRVGKTYDGIAAEIGCYPNSVRGYLRNHRIAFRKIVTVEIVDPKR